MNMGSYRQIFSPYHLYQRHNWLAAGENFLELVNPRKRQSNAGEIFKNIISGCAEKDFEANLTSKLAKYQPPSGHLS